MSDDQWTAAIVRVRAECLKTCPALLCEREKACLALLYDTPGFYERVQAVLAAPNYSCIECGSPIFSDEPVKGQICLDCITKAESK